MAHYMKNTTRTIFMIPDSELMMLDISVPVKGTIICTTIAPTMTGTLVPVSGEI